MKEQQPRHRRTNPVGQKHNFIQRNPSFESKDEPFISRKPQSSFIQAKLTIGAPNDPYEQEADRMAEHVMRKPSIGSAPPMISRIGASSLQRKCPDCERDEKGIVQRKCAACEAKEKGIIQRKEHGGGVASAGISSRLNSRKGQGSPLSPHVQREMGGDFGTDFSGVRVHTDSGAVQMSRELNARAFTHGQDVYFNQGEYDPGSSKGRRLLAHELTHTIQQTKNKPALQKLAEPEEQSPPSDLHCQPASSLPTEIVHEEINFPFDSSVISSSDSNSLNVFITSWYAHGANSRIRVDGYASAEGASNHNWHLSCDRAFAVANELISPSNGQKGIPQNFVDFFANGETNIISSTNYESNRIARVTVDLAPLPQQEELTCGPDITSNLNSVIKRVEPFFKGLSTTEKIRSCQGLHIGGLMVGVNPIMAWDVRDLFLPNTGFLDPPFTRDGCGSPRNPACTTDKTRKTCETPSTNCGNSVLVGGKCMLAGTANYALWGELCRLCGSSILTSHVLLNRAGLQDLIRAWKAVDGDDPEPPIAMALSGFDGTFPSIPAAAENRSHCTGRCPTDLSSFRFDFIWEPYKPR